MKRFLKNLLHPLFVIIYCLFLYLLYQLCKYGRGQFKGDIIVFAGCGIALMIWIMISIVFTYQKKDIATISYRHYLKIVCSFLLIITLWSGYQIVDMTIHYRGQIGFFMNDLLHKKTIELSNDNLYEGGFLTLIEDIRKEYNLPEQLYLNDSFELEYTYDGTIQSFDVMLYGKTENEDKSYLLSYKGQDKSVEIFIDNYVNMTYDPKADFMPLLHAMKVIPYTDSLDQRYTNYHMLYFGERDWGDNAVGIQYLDSSHHLAAPRHFQPIRGYTISIEPINGGMTPSRYIYVDDVNAIPTTFPESSNQENELTSIVDQVAYQLVVTDAALGSRFYSLQKTIPQESSLIINKDPFSGELGVASGIRFFTQDIGFIALSHSGGESAQLYYTHDGGLSFQQVILSTDEEYDYYHIPQVEDNQYILKISHADNDEDPNDCLIYISKDQGKTWSQR